MSLEIAQAVIAQARTNSDLVDTVKQRGNNISFGVFFNEAPQEAKMPYLTFSIITNAAVHDFCSNINDALIQIDIWEATGKDSAYNTLENLHNLEGYVNDTFNRQALPFSGNSSDIGCYLVNEIGPEKLDDCWRKINEYRIFYKGE